MVISLPNLVSLFWVWIALGTSVVYAALWYVSNRKLDPREPTVVRPWIPIPFVGHLVGMALFGGRYVKELGLSRPDEPIFTLPMPGSRVYVVTDPILATAVQRTPRTMSFSPLLPGALSRVFGLDGETLAILGENLDPEPGCPRGILADADDGMAEMLASNGGYLQQVSCDAGEEMRVRLCAFAEAARAGGDPESRDLLAWIRHLVSLTTFAYLFGPGNPLAKDPSLEEAYWAFDHGVGGFLIDVCPSLTVPAAYKGREALVKALLKFDQEGHYRTASKIVQMTHDTAVSYGLSREAMARTALSLLLAGIPNITITTFWVVARLFADRQLLGAVRDEVHAVLEASRAEQGKELLSVRAVREGCPVLLACIKECLRLGSNYFSTRLVQDDVVLSGRYMLKKGAMVQISTGVMHYSKSTWGADVSSFQPGRFLGSQDKKKQKFKTTKPTPKGEDVGGSGGVNVHPASFRPFGGGKTMCPGRHLATNKMALFAAMIVLGFDVTDGDGPVEVPGMDEGGLPLHVAEPGPGKGPRVVVRVREDGGGDVLGRLRVVG